MRKASYQFAILALSISVAVAGGCSDDDDGSEITPSGGAGGAAGAITITGGTSSGGSSNVGGEGGAPMMPGCTELEGIDMNCGMMATEAVFKRVNMMLVMDKSGSMQLPPVGGDVPRWDALKEALPIALNNATGDVNFGMILYPFSATSPIPFEGCTNCCEVPEAEMAVNVPIGPGSESIPAIIDALNNTSPGGGTPTAAGLERAFQYFSSPEGMALEGERYVLLATDGGPNCNDQITCDAETCTYNMDQMNFDMNACDASVDPNRMPPANAFCLDDFAVRAQIEALLGIGVYTFVVGIPGTEQYADYLNDFAVAGGVPLTGDTQYYAVDAAGGAEALADTLTSITTQLVRSCDIDMGRPPQNLMLVNVAVNCAAIPYVGGEGGAGGGEASGWVEHPDDPNRLLLKGATCDFVQTMGAERVDVIYGCPMIL